MNNKKIGGAAAAAIGALLFGGSQILDHEARIQALEDASGIEPPSELVGAEPIELSDEEQIEADEAEAEAQPLIEAEEPVEE